MEKFAILFVETGNASEAYRQAYDTNGSPATIKVKASQLCAKDNIRVTIDKAEGQGAAMVAASNGKAKLHGLLIDKTEVKSLSLVEVLNAANKS